MGKLTIQEIAKILVEKNKLTPKEANQFAAMMFEIIQQKLDEEGMVKIKGFGTFKMIRVEARESVSVRTGERVLIDSHAKITFTPDATMKELVNKPFSQFDTVVLNDGVKFEDIPEEGPEEQEQQEQETDRPVDVEPLDVDSPVVEDTPVVEEEVSEVRPLMEVVEEDATEYTTEDAPSIAYEEEERSSSWKAILGYCLLTLVLMALSAYGGYWYGTHSGSAVVPLSVDDSADIVVSDSIEIVDADSVVVVEDTDIKEEGRQEPPQEVKEPQTPEEEPSWKKYEAMDVRVRTGAYHIMGTDHEVTVRKGETLSRIARRELGEGMSCYIEVYNEIDAKTELKEGQVIKIPKLKWKKKRTLNN